MHNTSTMHLIYQNSEGQRFSQHWRDLTEMGTLVDPETGEDLELVGWHSAVETATQTEVQEAWHAGLDAGREQGRGKDHSHQPPSAPEAQGGGGVEYEFEVWQNDSLQAGGSTSDYATAKSEADHYALMYGQDGPVEVRMYEKRRITAPPNVPVGVVEALRYAVDNPEFDSETFDKIARAALRDYSQGESNE